MRKIMASLLGVAAVLSAGVARAADVTLLEFRVFVPEHAVRGSAAADVYPQRGIAVLGKVGMTDEVAAARVVVVSIGRDLHHGRDGPALRVRW